MRSILPRLARKSGTRPATEVKINKCIIHSLAETAFSCLARYTTIAQLKGFMRYQNISTSLG